MLKPFFYKKPNTLIFKAPKKEKDITLIFHFFQEEMESSDDAEVTQIFSMLENDVTFTKL